MPNHFWGVRLRALGAAAACSLAVVACGGDNDEDRDAKPMASGSSNASDDQTETTNDVPETDPSEPTSEPSEDAARTVILDRGRVPRVVQTFDVSEGQQLTSTMRTTVTTAVGGEQPPRIPLTIVSSVEVQEVTDELLTVQSTFDDVSIVEAGLPRGVVEELEPGIAALEGLAITTDQDRSGALLDVRFFLPDNAPPSIHQLVEQIATTVASSSVPFPTEPVGEGASWRVVEPREVGGLRMSHTTTYFLEELDGERYRISADVGGTFEPTAEEGMELVRGSVTGGGETSGVLGELMPTLMTLDATTTIVIKVGNRRVESVTDVEMMISTETK